MTKFLIRLFFLIPAVVFAQNKNWKLDAALGVGYGGYVETGKNRPVKSDWSGTTSTLSLGASAVGLTLAPYLRLGLMGSDVSKETWKQSGELAQENDMNFTGVDLLTGLEKSFQFTQGTLTPSVGFMARYLSFNREDFVLYGQGRAPVASSTGSVEELVEIYGVGGGLFYDFPLGDQWEMEWGTRAYWLFYTSAENDAFNANIEGDGGWIWQSTVSIAKKLIKTGQVMGVRIHADFQQITGGETLGSGGSIVEWPDNDFQNISAELFWRGTF